VIAHIARIANVRIMIVTIIMQRHPSDTGSMFTAVYYGIIITGARQVALWVN